MIVAEMIAQINALGRDVYKRQGWNQKLYVTNIANGKVAIGTTSKIGNTIAWVDKKNVKGCLLYTSVAAVVAFEGFARVAVRHAEAAEHGDHADAAQAGEVLSLIHI